jgi:hypothetical protein
MDGNMNDTRNDGEDFSLKRQDSAGRDPNADKSDEARATTSDKSPSAMVGGNALPDRIRRKYYVVANEPGKDGPDGEARLYADERGEYLAFKVTGDRLVTRLAAAEVIRDMVSVAQHRQWESLQVRGSVEFRREAWLEAGARGLEVQGYQPTELDRQTLAERREVWDRAHSDTSKVEARSASDRGERADKFDYDKGISGRLIEVGQAPYRNRTDAEASTYVALELYNGRQHQVWGVGLEKATADSNAKPGDRVHVRRDGVERVTKEIKVIDAISGHAHIEQRQVPRNRWQVTAEKFRTADRQTVGRDPALVAAQSQMVLIEKALERVFPRDVGARHGIMEVAKERIAQHLGQGHSFAQARIIEPIQDLDRSERNKDEARQNRNGGRVRIQQRER